MLTASLLSLSLIFAPCPAADDPPSVPPPVTAADATAPCYGTRCATGMCVPLGAVCPSPVEAGLQAPEPSQPTVDVEIARAARRERESRRERQREIERERERDFERAVLFNKLGFGLGAGSAFSAAAGAFVGAGIIQRGHRVGCKVASDLFAGGGALSCPDYAPGFGLAVGFGVGFAVAGMFFAVLAANSPERVARRMKRLSFVPRGFVLRF